MKKNLSKKKVKWSSGGMYQLLLLPRSSTINLIWCRDAKICKIVEFSCPADVNVIKKIQEKEDNYGTLIHMLQVRYPEYGFLFIPVIVGAMGAITIDLKSNIKKLGFNENEASKMIKMIQQKRITGSVKTCKTFINFKT